MKFEKVLLLRAYDSGVQFGVLTAHSKNDEIFETIKGEKARILLEKNLANPGEIPTRGRRKAIAVGVVADGEVYDMEGIRTHLASYGIMKLEHVSNKRISIKIKDKGLVIENLEEVFKNKRIYDYIDMFTEDTKVKYVKSKDSFMCEDKAGNRSFKRLILKAEVRCQLIKDEYIDVFGELPDQQ